MPRAAAFLGGVLLLGSVALQAQITASQQNPVHTFSTPGTHEVTLRTCNEGGCTTVTKTVTVLNPVPSIVSAVVGMATAEAGQLISLSGAGKGKPPLAYTWRVFQGLSLVREVSGALGWLDTEGLSPGVYAVVLRITNSSGQADSLPAPLILVSPAATDFYTLTPCRFLDTRIGQPLQAGVTKLITLNGACGIPANARSLAVNITAITATGRGSLVMFPGNYPFTGTSTISFKAGATVSNNSIVQLSTDSLGMLSVLPAIPGGGSMHLTIDVFGYFAP